MFSTSDKHLIIGVNLRFLLLRTIPKFKFIPDADTKKARVWKYFKQTFMLGDWQRERLYTQLLRLPGQRCLSSIGTANQFQSFSSVSAEAPAGIMKILLFANPFADLLLPRIQVRLFSVASAPTQPISGNFIYGLSLSTQMDTKSPVRQWPLTIISL